MTSLFTHPRNNTYGAPIAWDAFGGKDLCSLSLGLFLTQRGHLRKMWIGWHTETKQFFQHWFHILVHRIYCICETSLSLWIGKLGRLATAILVCSWFIGLFLHSHCYQNQLLMAPCVSLWVGSAGSSERPVLVLCSARTLSTDLKATVKTQAQWSHLLNFSIFGGWGEREREGKEERERS